MFNDEYLEYWGTVFVAGHMLEHGISFCEFLHDPWGYLKAVGLGSAPLCLARGYQPPLPRQAKVAQALWRRWDQENGGEPRIHEERPALVAEEEGNP